VQRTVHAAGNRLLVVEDRGDPAGRPVLVHHGMPSSRLITGYRPHERDAVERGLRLISYDRPGYGQSSPQPGRRVADTAADVRAICAELGIRRLVTWGHSGGGPHALACAALLPELVTSAAVLGSPAPFADNPEYFAGMDPGYAEEIRIFLTDKPAAGRKLDQDREDIIGVAPGPAAGAARAAESTLLPADAARELGAGKVDAREVGADEFDAGEFLEFFLSCTQAGLAPGSQGWWDDHCMLEPWGFDPADIAVPVLLVYGGRDVFIPAGHGQWLAQRIPGAESRLLAEEGHATLLNFVPETQAWLSEHL
jgi:pimeloyl-ACP methyl ester carboxylesterase